MILHVYERARMSAADEVIVATDDIAVAEVVRAAGGDVCLTRTDHESGTDRLFEVCEQRSFAPDDIIVNVQGDEPLIPPAAIEVLARRLAEGSAGMATLWEAIINPEDVFDPNIVKVVCDERERALYFSRAPVPFDRETFGGSAPSLPAGDLPWKRHLGMYAYRVAMLRQFVSWAPAPIELIEKLEQLRALWHGVEIQVTEAPCTIPPGVDTPADLERTRRAFGAS